MQKININNKLYEITSCYDQKIQFINNLVGLGDSLNRGVPKQPFLKNQFKLLKKKFSQPRQLIECQLILIIVNH